MEDGILEGDIGEEILGWYEENLTLGKLKQIRNWMGFGN